MAWPAVELDPIVGALKQRRKARKETQMVVAGRMGIHLATISAWERGTKEPNLQSLRKWCAALDVEIGLWEKGEEDVADTDTS